MTENDPERSADPSVTGPAEPKSPGDRSALEGERTADDRKSSPGEARGGREGRLDLDLVMDVPVTMQVVLGSTTMSVADILDLGRGAVVKLDTRVGDPVDVVVNGRTVARGEIVVLDKEDQRFGITLTEVSRPGGAKLPKSAGRAA